jgi:hypothetical protein
MTDLLETASEGKAVARREETSVQVITSEPGQLLTAIVSLAKDPAVDVSKLQALMTMQERMEDRQAEREFAQALTRLSGKLPRIKKNGTISLGQGKGEIPFAKWEDMDKVVRPLLDEEGFTLSFNSEPRPGDGGGAVITGTLLHRDGHSMKASMSLPLDSGPGRNNLQAMGSTLSYGKRYCAEMLLNLVREGADDDGKTGGAIDKLLTDTKADRPRFMQMFGIADLTTLTEQSYVAAKNMLSARAAKPQAGGQ